MGDSAAWVPFHRRLTFRLAVLIAVALIVVDISTIPLWNWLYYYLMPEWGDPGFVREYLAYLELSPEEMAEADGRRFESTLDLRGRAILYGTVVLYTVIFAALLSFFVSRMATARIRRLASQVQVSSDVPALPGPFEVGGSDEIQLLASTMNGMRERILVLIDELEARDRLRTEWVSGVSHDLRAPLTALSAALDRSRRVIRELPECDVPEGEKIASVDRSLRDAQLDVRRVADLAEDLLEIARLETGGELVVEPVPTGELLRTAVCSLRPMAEERDLDLQLDYPAGLPELRADGHRLLRALENIIVNSLQHARHSVQVRATVSRATLEIAVLDDGVGLPEVDGRAVLGGLGADRRRADSNGLGLEVARRIVEAHGGTLEGENQPGGGALVRIAVPVGDYLEGASVASA